MIGREGGCWAGGGWGGVLEGKDLRRNDRKRGGMWGWGVLEGKDFRKNDRKRGGMLVRNHLFGNAEGKVSEEGLSHQEGQFQFSA